MRIGIYGGTFNPIHIGHMHVADTAARQLKLDTVFFVPSKSPYRKVNNELETNYVRRTMVYSATSIDQRFCLGEDGCKANEPTYTYQTVMFYRSQYPNDKIYFIVGEDAFLDMFTWKNYLEIFGYIDGIYVHRRGESKKTVEELKNMYPIEVYVNPSGDTINISSSLIRQKLKSGEACQYLLPMYVYQYILRHKLYKDWEGMK